MVDYRPHGIQELVESPKSCETSEYSFLFAIKYQSQPSSEQPKSRTELTQSYRRSNSEEEEKRAPIREVGANHAADAWAALCSWTLWKFSVMVLCWSHPPGRVWSRCLQAHTVFCLLDCLQQRWLQFWRSLLPPGNLLNTAPFLTYPSVSFPHRNRGENTHIRADQDK